MTKKTTTFIAQSGNITNHSIAEICGEMPWLTHELVAVWTYESVRLLSSTGKMATARTQNLLALLLKGKKVRTVHLYLWQQIDMFSYDYVLGNITLFYIPKHVII